MYVENFIKILNETDSDRFTHLFFNKDVTYENSICRTCSCPGISCENCPFTNSENFEKFKQELNQRVTPILNLKNMIGE